MSDITVHKGAALSPKDKDIEVILKALGSVPGAAIMLRCETNDQLRNATRIAKCFVEIKAGLVRYYANQTRPLSELDDFQHYVAWTLIDFYGLVQDAWEGLEYLWAKGKFTEIRRSSAGEVVSEIIDNMVAIMMEPCLAKGGITRSRKEFLDLLEAYEKPEEIACGTLNKRLQKTLHKAKVWADDNPLQNLADLLLDALIKVAKTSYRTLGMSRNSHRELVRNMECFWKKAPERCKDLSSSLKKDPTGWGWRNGYYLEGVRGGSFARPRKRNSSDKDL